MELAQTVLKMRLTGGGICQSHLVIVIVIHLCVCVWVYMHTCVWGVAASVNLSVLTLSARHCYWTWHSSWVSSRPLGWDPPVCTTLVLRALVHMATSGLCYCCCSYVFYGCWGFKHRSSRLLRHTLYQLRHLTSPVQSPVGKHILTVANTYTVDLLIHILRLDMSTLLSNACLECFLPSPLMTNSPSPAALHIPRKEVLPCFCLHRPRHPQLSLSRAEDVFLYPGFFLFTMPTEFIQFIQGAL